MEHKLKLILFIMSLLSFSSGISTSFYVVDAPENSSAVQVEDSKETNILSDKAFKGSWQSEKSFFFFEEKKGTFLLAVTPLEDKYSFNLAVTPDNDFDDYISIYFKAKEDEIKTENSTISIKNQSNSVIEQKFLKTRSLKVNF